MRNTALIDTQWLSRSAKKAVPITLIESVSKRCLALLGFPSFQVEIVWVSSQKMRAFNRRFRKKDYATDVLSFPYFAAKHGVLLQVDPKKLPLEQRLLGSLVIALPVMQRQAKEFGCTRRSRDIALIGSWIVPLSWL